MTPSPTLRAIQAEAAPHMARCGKLTVHSTWHDRVFGSHERPRRGELVDAGLVRDSGKMGRTMSGARAVLWEITPEGRKEVGL